MTAILGITFPIYATIAIGYGLVRFAGFRDRDMRVLGTYVMNVALPALLFSTLAGRDFAQIFHPGYVLCFLAGGLATIALAYLWFTLTAIDPARRALAVMGSSCPNSGFVGYPIILLALPQSAGIVLALNLLVESLVLIPICLVLIDAARGPAQTGWARRIGGIFLGVLRRPLMIGLLAGLIVSLTGATVPAALHSLVSMLAASAAALSLIAIGGALVGLPLRGNRALAAQIAAGKLLLHPALVALAALILPALGLVALPADLHAAVILSAAMPMFGIYVVLAQEQGLQGAASIAMLAATSGGFFTISALLALLT